MSAQQGHLAQVAPTFQKSLALHVLGFSRGCTWRQKRHNCIKTDILLGPLCSDVCDRNCMCRHRVSYVVSSQRHAHQSMFISVKLSMAPAPFVPLPHSRDLLNSITSTLTAILSTSMPALLQIGSIKEIITVFDVVILCCRKNWLCTWNWLIY